MDPPAVWTQIEHWDNEGKPYLKEYEGRGQLEGKAALITGGDSGIGRSVAILMAREGADITICYLPAEQEDADWTIKYIEKAGRKAHGFAADLRDHDNAKKAVEEHMRVHGRLNILVPNG
jgi:NAD(P)-dependent dehydrogenase (short-subunit alcohol dehydrogenase family)